MGEGTRCAGIAPGAAPVVAQLSITPKVSNCDTPPPPEQ